MALELSAAEARTLAITAQGLTARRHRDPLRLLEQLSAIQIDTISVMARSHELVAFSRLAPISAAELARAWWGSGGSFEYWAHAACIVPMDLWPLFAWRRRRYRRRWPERTAQQEAILAQLRGAGSVTTTDLGGARTKPGWWEWSPSKSAVEQLLARGEVVCTERRGFRRVYRLADDAVPRRLLDIDMDDVACFAALTGRAAAHLGVATADDLADYFRLPVAVIPSAAEAAGLSPVTVPGWGRRAWADPAALGRPMRAPRHRPVLLSPFDSLIWHRPRTERVFGFRHRLEAYTPAPRREHGYFVMPLLASGRLAGRVDPRREGRVLRVLKLSLQPHAVAAMAEALRTAAAWVGCEDVVIDEVLPLGCAAPLRHALARAEPTTPSGDGG